MVLLSVLLILFVCFLFFSPFRTSSNEQKAAEFRRRQRALMYKARVAAGNDEEPIIFSKYEQLNQTRKVKLFKFYLYFSYYCNTIVAF
jgi:hypothetical protein